MIIDVARLHDKLSWTVRWGDLTAEELRKFVYDAMNDEPLYSFDRRAISQAFDKQEAERLVEMIERRWLVKVWPEEGTK